MKRFYKTVTVVPIEGGHTVALDGRGIKTPGKHDLRVRRAALAEALAGEWQAQEDEIEPEKMPLTGLVNTALDRVAANVETVVRELARYGETDLLYYRAIQPERLVAAQARAWDPVLDWLGRRHGLTPKRATGVMPVTQSGDFLAALPALVPQDDAVVLTGFASFVRSTGSLVLGRALLEHAFSSDDVWRAATLDEEFQFAEWGEDEDARAALALRKAEFDAAVRLLALLGE